MEAEAAWALGTGQCPRAVAARVPTSPWTCVYEVGVWEVGGGVGGWPEHWGSRSLAPDVTIH